MNEGLVSRRYAKSLLKYAQDRRTAEQMYKKMKVLEESFVTHPDLEKSLHNPVLSVQDKENLLLAAVGTAAGEDFLRFIRLVIKNRRESFMRSIGLMYQKLYRELNHISLAQITTAVPVGGEILDKIKQLISRQAGQTVEYTYRIDPSIIGGFVLKIDSMQLDASVDKELKLLRLKLLNSKQRL
ncbi:MAG: F0F1 ATP synthase subunit delta [Coprobacter sp.]|nr:F0F1 ATP synthase subunit delta [Coprobacter sp.]